MLSDASSSLNKDSVASYIHRKNFRDSQDTATRAAFYANAIRVQHNLSGNDKRGERNPFTHPKFVDSLVNGFSGGVNAN